ncbi:major royal jelly protein 1-like [Anthonomus grandis grandis]|uniref:major royal jelly protein 1-like n=1 Tax=Anthonomus grandis grandis TaxID=2921223 RepID=UPI00216539BD|nr:major royal jelly protein 1-like [Anthonomus grandis grandis]
MFSSVLISLALCITFIKASNQFIEWTGATFDFPDETTELNYKTNELYISKNIIASCAGISNDDVFVALPRYKPGVPATLARLYLIPKYSEPVLVPFPCWSEQELSNQTGLKCVVHICIDAHGILWAIDNGVVNILENPIRKCLPKVVGYNIATGERVKTLDMSGLVVKASRIQFVIADYGNDGQPFIYVTDAATRSVLVFDVIGEKGYRLVLPKAITEARKDVLYAALIQKSDRNKYLILTYLSGSRIFSIRTDYLRAGAATGKVEDLGVKDGKIIVLGTDGGSALFYRYEGKPEIYRWDANNSTFSRGEMVYTSPSCYLSTCVMPDIKRRSMRVLESNFPDFFNGTVGCGVSQRITLMAGKY